MESEYYRHGFNGMEKDDEMKGQGNFYTTEFRQYDSRSGIWVSVDPLAEERPMNSLYNFCTNNPNRFIDPNGMLETEFKDLNGNTTKTVDDGSNAVFQEMGKGTDKHYEFTGYNEELKGENVINIGTAIQEQQILNNRNPSLQENAQGQGETHCNQATQNIMKTVASADSNPKAIVKGNANSMITTLENGLNLNYKKVDQITAEKNAESGNLVIIGWKNPSGHGHVLTYSVGENISKGKVANIGPKKYTGFVSLNSAINKTKEKVYFVYIPLN
jgi:RHS repeat-associated protein